MLLRNFSFSVALVSAAPAACRDGAAPAMLREPGGVASVAVVLDVSLLAVGTTTTARAVAQDQYGATLAAPSVSWRISGGQDVASVSEGGVVTGVALGIATVEATVDSVRGERQFQVVSPGNAQATAPILPQVTLDFPFPPVTGRSIHVGQSDNLQSALNSAQRGDEVVIAAGINFAGNFVLPAKPGSAANGWIVVRTERLADLPAEGTRVGPAQGSLMARISTPNAQPAIRTAPGASGWRLAGLDITVDVSFQETQYGIVALGDGSGAQNSLTQVPTDLVLDRVWVHGQDGTNLQRCIALNSARTQVNDSYISECHGKGFDSQAIGGWNGPGPYRIVNNMLMGAGENLFFGGADPAIQGLVPSDIEVRGNYLYTPVAWKGRWSKKNIFELKNAARVLVENNVFDGAWQDAQVGEAIVLKSVNQDGGCRWCRTTDVTIRRNLIRNAAGGVSIAGRPEAHPVDTAARRILLSENVFDGIGTGPYSGSRRGILLLSQAAMVTIERTVLSGSLAGALYVEAGAPCVFRDNIWARGDYGVIASGAGVGTSALNAGCGSSYSWSGNLIVGTVNGTYPFGTAWIASEALSPLAAQIRSAVTASTTGVAIP